MLVKLRVLALRVLLFSVPFATYSQISMRGVVTDANSQKPLPFVNVMVSNTTKGTMTDTSGVFTFSRLPEGKYMLLVSSVGYQSYTQEVTVSVSKNPVALTIRLLPQAQDLDEVTIKVARGKQWEQDLKSFKKAFLGTDTYAQGCQILNRQVLDFKRKEGTLTASATAPLLIENRKLGYKITFVLKRFEASATNFLISGDTYFEELIPTPSERTQWQTNRKEAYLGSLTHFLRALARQTATDEGFELYAYTPGGEGQKHTSNFSYNINVQNTLKKVSPDSLVRRDGSSFWLDLSRRLEIHYTQKEDDFKTYVDVPYQVSQIESKNRQVAFVKEGVFVDKYATTTVGSFNNYRVATMLPIEYEISMEEVKVLKRNTSNQYGALQEKIFIHANQSNYQAGDTLWFKTYQVYQHPLYRDALSKLIYVDLIDPHLTILDSRILKSNNGVAWGDFKLADTLQTGRYYVRAYTHWMRNYGDSTQAVVEIPVFGRGETGLFQSAALEQDSTLKIELAKSVFQKGERMDFSVRGLPMTSYSVTIASERVAGRGQPRETLAFNPSFTLENVSYPVETGLTFYGKIKNKQQKPVSTEILVVRQDTLLVDKYASNGRGEFTINDMIGHDSLRFEVIATDAKGKPLPFIEVTPPEPLSFNYVRKTPVSFEVKRLNEDFVPKVEKKSIQLAEVAVREKRRLDTTQITRMHKIFGKPTYEFTDKDLNFEGKTHFIQAIQNKVAGLEVFIDAVTGQIRLRSLKHGDAQPVIWLDGIRYDNINQLSHLTGAMIARIDVYRTNTAMIVPKFSAGLIAIYTKSFIAGDDLGFEALPPAEGIRRFKFRGIHTPKNFYILDVQKDKLEMSGFENRSTLYWKPDLLTNHLGEAKLMLTAYGKVGTYRVEVIGYDENGRISKTTKQFEIQ